jgi:hypothetical protein
MDVDQSFHAPANGALHAGGSSWAFTRRADKINGKDNDANSLQVDLYVKQGHQTDLPEAMELKRRTMIDNGNILSYFVADAFFLLSFHFRSYWRFNLMNRDRYIWRIFSGGNTPLVYFASYFVIFCWKFA